MIKNWKVKILFEEWVEIHVPTYGIVNKNTKFTNLCKNDTFDLILIIDFLQSDTNHECGNIKRCHTCLPDTYYASTSRV